MNFSNYRTGRAFPRRGIGKYLYRLIAASALAFLEIAAVPYANASSAVGVPATRSMTFNIPAGDLGTALAAYAVEAKAQIEVPSTLVQGLTTNGVSGNYTPEVALDILLNSTGLTYKSAGSNMITILKTANISRREKSAVAQRTDDNGLEELVVTARRKEEKLQTVPISITAFSQQDLKQNNIESYSSLQFAVPSLSLASPYREALFVDIRGQGGYAPGTDAGVAVYLNETPLPSPPGSQGAVAGGGGNGLFFDLDNLQVLKGPQGTLFGRNTTGGAILIQSKRPQGDFGGYAEVTLGSYNDQEIDLALNIPIVADKLLVRIAGNGVLRDGFTESLGTTNRAGNIDLDNRNSLAGRVTVTFRPTDDIQNDLIYQGVVDRTNGDSDILTYVDKGSTILSIFPNILAILRQQQALGIRTEVPSGINTYDHISLTTITDILRYDFSDDIIFRNIFGFVSTKSAETYDASGTIDPIYNSLGPTTSPALTQYSEEPQVQGTSFGGKLTWVAGGFYLDAPKPDATVSGTVVFGTPSYTSSIASETSKAIYAQATYDLSDFVSGLKATGGFRYTWDHRYLENADTTRGGACLFPCDRVTLQADFAAPTWTVGLDYQVSEDSLLYVVSRRGYRSGGFNPSALVGADQAFGPEFYTDVEVGIKSEWEIAGMKARTNGDLFHGDYTDIQVQQIVLELTRPIAVQKNAAEAEEWGAEFEGSIFPTKDLELGAQFSWLSFKYTKFDPGVDGPLIEENTLDNRPQYKYNISARYHLPLDPTLGDVSLSANWNWQSKTATSAPPIDAYGYQNAFGLLNLGANWRNIAGSAFDASFFMTNALDHVYAVGGYDLALIGLGTDSVTYGEPRMFGFRLRYRFGADAQ